MSIDRRCLQVLSIVVALAPLPVCAETVRVYVTNSAGDSIHVIGQRSASVAWLLPGPSPAAR